jgi:hypothetical protein
MRTPIGMLQALTVKVPVGGYHGLLRQASLHNTAKHRSAQPALFHLSDVQHSFPPVNELSTRASGRCGAVLHMFQDSVENTQPPTAIVVS